jgi:hypothetical protein
LIAPLLFLHSLRHLHHKDVQVLIEVYKAAQSSPTSCACFRGVKLLVVEIVTNLLQLDRNQPSSAVHRAFFDNASSFLLLSDVLAYAPERQLLIALDTLTDYFVGDAGSEIGAASSVVELIMPALVMLATSEKGEEAIRYKAFFATSALVECRPFASVIAARCNDRILNALLVTLQRQASNTEVVMIIINFVLLLFQELSRDRLVRVVEKCMQCEVGMLKRRMVDRLADAGLRGKIATYFVMVAEILARALPTESCGQSVDLLKESSAPTCIQAMRVLLEQSNSSTIEAISHRILPMLAQLVEGCTSAVGVNSELIPLLYQIVQLDTRVKTLVRVSSILSKCDVDRVISEDTGWQLLQALARSNSPAVQLQTIDLVTRSSRVSSSSSGRELVWAITIIAEAVLLSSDPSFLEQAGETLCSLILNISKHADAALASIDEMIFETMLLAINKFCFETYSFTACQPALYAMLASRHLTIEPDTDEAEPTEICSVCLERELCERLQPCEHSFCVQCAPRLTSCPLCRSTIRETEMLSKGVTSRELTAKSLVALVELAEVATVSTQQLALRAVRCCLKRSPTSGVALLELKQLDWMAELVQPVDWMVVDWMVVDWIENSNAGSTNAVSAIAGSLVASAVHNADRYNLCYNILVLLLPCLETWPLAKPESQGVFLAAVTDLCRLADSPSASIQIACAAGFQRLSTAPHLARVLVRCDDRLQIEQCLARLVLRHCRVGVHGFAHGDLTGAAAGAQLSCREVVHRNTRAASAAGTAALALEFDREDGLVSKALAAMNAAPSLPMDRIRMSRLWRGDNVVLEDTDRGYGGAGDNMTTGARAGGSESAEGGAGMSVTRVIGHGAMLIKRLETARCARSVNQGSWYFEASIVSLGGEGDDTGALTGGGSSARGHVRVGWATSETDMDRGIGADDSSIGLQDCDYVGTSALLCFGARGSSGRSKRKPAAKTAKFGAAYTAGSVVGCLAAVERDGTCALSFFVDGVFHGDQKVPLSYSHPGVPILCAGEGLYPAVSVSHGCVVDMSFPSHWPELPRGSPGTGGPDGQEA